MTVSENGHMFSSSYLKRLIVPLMLETTLGVTIGIADTAMVASAGEAALSGVSLVDSLGALFVFLVTAFSTGGAVVISQYLGRGDRKNASESARNLLQLSLVVFVSLASMMLVFRDGILSLLFGTVEPSVSSSSKDYYLPIMLSVPFLAISSASSAILRTMGKTKASMYTSLGTNLINITGNAILIFIFSMGAAGAGFATLVSRIFSAMVLLIIALSKRNEVSIRGLFSRRMDLHMSARIFSVALPSGLENSIFHIGKILMTSTISLLGTSAISAYAVTNSLANFSNLFAQAVGLASITVIGQCVGASRIDEARYYSRKLLIISYLFTIISCLILIVFINPLLGLYALEEEAFQLARKVGIMLFAQTAIFWPMGFTLPNFLRAAGDVKYTMTVSILSMWIFRVSLAYILGITLSLGLEGVFLAMFIDWYCRIVFFTFRYRGHKWEDKAVI